MLSLMNARTKFGKVTMAIPNNRKLPFLAEFCRIKLAYWEWHGGWPKASYKLLLLDNLDIVLN
ncbi:hypothetical protein EDC63_11372 [Sulfurirhabdus autotrophica]|uniref:Uncharacterized protein n=1 Tax=Sulfurirhabdus autotrophica TaxID=1706046 RepID=A0A4R3XXV7_9PROT|nr:hypothetical protein EDC63_11372 [Sulfurirhabdus autotrophica]